jgi:hypothetical protein
MGRLGRRHRGRTLCLAVGLMSGIIGAGCSRQNATSKYIPSPQNAETALTTAFAAWKAGTPAGPVEGTSPLVHVTDTYRRPAEKLVEFQILGEVPGDTPRCYAVELRFDPPREEKARYVVVGIDPLWIFRLEDFQLLAHWEHNMQTPESTNAENASK